MFDLIEGQENYVANYMWETLIHFLYSCLLAKPLILFLKQTLAC